MIKPTEEKSLSELCIEAKEFIEASRSGLRDARDQFNLDTSTQDRLLALESEADHLEILTRRTGELSEKRADAERQVGAARAKANKASVVRKRERTRWRVSVTPTDKRYSEPE